MKNIFNYILKKDRQLLYIINNKFKCKFFDLFMPYITLLGGVVFTILLPLLLISIGKDRTRLLGIEIIFSLAISNLFVQLIKRKTSRLRPYDILENINNFNMKLKDHSFPSGHTTATFSIATVLAMNMQISILGISSIALTVGVSRIYLGVHYPSDVAVGMVLGSITSFLIHPYFI